MRRFLCLLLCLMMALPLTSALAEEGASSPEEVSLALSPVETVIRPGKSMLLSVTVPEDGLCDVLLRGPEGETVLPIVLEYPVTAGENYFWWNGTYNNVFAPEGQWTMALVMNGQEAAQTVTVGPAAPYIANITPVKDASARQVRVDFFASVDGLLTVGLWAGDVWTILESRQISAGMNGVTWDASNMPLTDVSLTLTLTDGTGFSSTEEHIPLRPEDFGLSRPTPTPSATPTATPSPTPTATPTAAPSPTPSPTPTPTATLEPVILTPEPAATPTPTPIPEITFTPSYGSPYEVIEGEAANYWNTPMDVTDEEAMWEMLSAPFTYVDESYKAQTRVYAEPDENSRTVAMVTGMSQGVRVIETLDNGWTLIELYSSTFHDNPIDAWNMLVQGYVRTDKLKTKEMTAKYHIVVDKLTQRLYLFSEEGLVTTLLVSTGLANADQPYNETRSGEFLYISATGGFKSDNMYCPMAMKFNDGDLLHEVPYIQRYEGGSKIYSATEPYLGQRASHGCIRVQRKKTPEGISMQWIWDHRKEIGRIVVWEDWQGRQIDIPADDTLLYYNPKGGSYYHRAEKCASAKDSVVFETFTYAELDTGAYAKLEFCPYCAPALRRAEIEAINEAHALGGDHDPVLTQCRMEYLSEIPYEELTPGELRYWVEEAVEE